MINFTASIKPKGMIRYNDANITASLRQLLTTLRTSCDELDGKIDAKIKSLFNTAISSVSNAVSSNGTRGVGKAVADVKKLFSVTIPSKIKQAISKALDAVIKFFEWLESSAPDSERKKYSKEANEVFKQWKYKRKAIKAGKQTGEGPEITVINPHDDPTGAKSRELLSKRANKKSRNVPEEEKRFAERIRSPQYAAEQKVKLNEQIAKDQKKLEKEAKKTEKASKLLTSNQSSQLKYIKEYMENNGFSRELKFKVYKEYAKNVYKFAGKEPEKVINTILGSIKGKKYSLTSLLSGIKTKGIRKTQSHITRSTSRSISLARKRKSLNEMRRKLASCHVIIRNAKQIILQFKKIPQTYSELINGFKEVQKLVVSSEAEIKDTEKLIDASEEAIIDAEKVEEVAKDAAIDADKAEEAVQKESESPTTTQAKIEKKEEEAEKKLEVAEKKEKEAKKTSEAAEKKVNIAEKKVDTIEKKVATAEKKVEALSELADKTLKVTPATNAEKTANVAKTIAPISSAAKEVNEADKKINKAVEANNIVTLRESLMDYMDNHGLKARKGVVSGRFTQLANKGQIKGTESLQDIISLFKLDNPDNAMQGSVVKTTTNTPKTQPLQTIDEIKKKITSYLKSKGINDTDINFILSEYDKKIKRHEIWQNSPFNDVLNSLGVLKPNDIDRIKNISEIRSKIREYMDEHGYLSQAISNAIRTYNTLIKREQLKGNEDLKRVLIAIDVEQPNTTSGAGSAAQTNTQNNKVEKNESIKANETAEIIKESRDVEKILADMKKRTEFSKRSMMGIRENGSIYMSPDALTVKVQQDELDNIRTLLNEAVKESATSPKKARNTLNIAKMRMREVMRMKDIIKKKLKTAPKTNKLAKRITKSKNPKEELSKVLSSKKRLAPKQREINYQMRRPFTQEEIYNLGKIINNSIIDKINDAANDANTTIYSMENLPFYTITPGRAEITGDNMEGTTLVAKQDISRLTFKLKEVVRRINNKLNLAKEKYGYRPMFISEEDSKKAINEKRKLEEQLSQTLYWIKSIPHTMMERIKTAKELYKKGNDFDNKVLQLKALALPKDKNAEKKNIKKNKNQNSEFYNEYKRAPISPATVTNKNAFAETYNKQVKKELKETLSSLKELLSKGISVLYNTTSTVKKIDDLTNNTKAIGYDG